MYLDKKTYKDEHFAPPQRKKPTLKLNGKFLKIANHTMYLNGMFTLACNCYTSTLIQAKKFTQILNKKNAC